MAVQAEMGDSASDAAIKQVEVEATPPISDVSLHKILLLMTVLYNGTFMNYELIINSSSNRDELPHLLHFRFLECLVI